MSYQISEFAKQCNVNKETIRYYEGKGLIQKHSRQETGYRLYTEEDVRRVKFIKRLQKLGFTLNEIHKLLGVVDQDDARCAGMYEFVTDKLVELHQKLEELKKVEQMLGQLRDSCPNRKELYTCPIIETLSEE